MRSSVSPLRLVSSTSVRYYCRFHFNFIPCPFSSRCLCNRVRASPSSGSLVRPLLKSDHGEQGKSISLCNARLFVRCANGRSLENRCRCDSIKCRGMVYLRFHFWRNKKKTEVGRGREDEDHYFSFDYFFCSVCICTIRS